MTIRPTIHAKCGKTARTTKYGAPYTLICQLHPRHPERLCRDIDNGISFEPDGGEDDR